MNRESPPPLDSRTPGAGCEPAPSFADQRLEDAIETTRQALLGAKSRVIQRELAEQMRRLIGQRSPWMVAHLERERGLR